MYIKKTVSLINISYVSFDSDFDDILILKLVGDVAMPTETGPRGGYRISESGVPGKR